MTCAQMAPAPSASAVSSRNVSMSGLLTAVHRSGNTGIASARYVTSTGSTVSGDPAMRSVGPHPGAKIMSSQTGAASQKESSKRNPVTV
ncbi:hypothetical protein GCM10017771_34750 [Streptomyces capitiformicae]|uniref:Uncharacterized protein n=1 Tax=Streptomyces capitiformicae TaxID=2014920 RepID=A0A919GQZ8_9ACTN|nr:hypothetical protein GCM10017771_34750 [Streptomyces capitiformicae]